MRRRLLFFLVLQSFISGAQEPYYANPLKIPLLLSGSFAELRSNHFHSGVDFKTQGVSGHNVHAAADGYVARIVVSPGGFGKALYIKHPNGTTTVYAHLLEFNAVLEKYVKDQQYLLQKFRVDLEVPEYLFPVKQNEVIAKSGNSGSSGGPHLHFEIRDNKTEEPLNPLLHNFPVDDDIPPRIFSVLLVPLNQQSFVNGVSTPQSFQVILQGKGYRLKGNPTLLLWGKIGLAVESYDYFNGSHNKCGINSLQMSVDDETQFAFELSRFSFENSRYLNSHIVYGEYQNSNRKFIKTWLDPGNRLPIYTYNASRGVIVPENGKVQQVELKLQDTYGNVSELAFSFIGEEQTYKAIENKKDTLFYYNKENSLKNTEMELIIPEGALYDNFEFEYKQEIAPPFFYSNYHYVHNEKVPLHKPAQIRIRANNIPVYLEEKVLLVNVQPKTEKYSAVGGKYNNGWVEATTRNLGVFTLSVDTLAPNIVPFSLKNNSLTESKRIRFKITDDLAGIETIDAWMDGKWVLFDYDAKTASISHYFDAERFTFNKRHNFRLEVTDYRGNMAIYETTFWK